MNEKIKINSSRLLQHMDGILSSSRYLRNSCALTFVQLKMSRNTNVIKLNACRIELENFRETVKLYTKIRDLILDNIRLNIIDKDHLRSLLEEMRDDIGNLAARKALEAIDAEKDAEKFNALANQCFRYQNQQEICEDIIKFVEKQ